MITRFQIKRWDQNSTASTIKHLSGNQRLLFEAGFSPKRATSTKYDSIHSLCNIIYIYIF